jgi:hypothetical protein
MAQAQRDDLLFASGDLLARLRRLGVAAAAPFNLVRQLL